MAEGRLSVTELEERLDRVYAAKTVGELQPLTRDLPVGQAMPVAPRPAAVPSDRIGGRGTSSAAVAVMSGSERKGHWTVPPTFNAFALMGGVVLDLTNARFEDRETTIQAVAIMGGIDIKVPDDITVHVTGVGFMGAFVDEAGVIGPEGAPVVKVTGFAFWGGVDVKRVARKAVDQRRDRPQLES